MSSILLSTLRYLIVMVASLWLLIWSLDIKFKPQKSLYERIIGNPKTIDSLEVAEFDDWGGYNDILETLTGIGEGWRIPTIDEYKLLNENRGKLNLDSTGYWSSDSTPNDPLEKMQISIPSGKTYPVNINEYKRWTEISGADRQPVRFVRNVPNNTFNK